MNAIIDFSTLARRYVYDDVQGVRAVRNNPGTGSIEISVKFRFRASNARILDALYDRSIVKEHFEAIDLARDVDGILKAVKMTLREGRLNLPASVFMELPDRGRVRVDIPVTKFTGHLAQRVRRLKVPLGEVKNVAKRLVASVSCLDDVLRSGLREEPNEKDEAKKPGCHGFRIFHKLNDPDLGAFDVMVTILEYSPKTVNAYDVNVTGGYGFSEVEMSVNVHKPTEIEFVGRS